MLETFSEMTKNKWRTKNDGKVNEFFLEINDGNKEFIIFTIAKQL